MAVEDTVRIRFVANTAAFGAGLSKASRSLSKFGTNAFFLGSRITAGIGLPIALLTKAVIGIGSAFDQAMTESLAIMGRDGQAMRGQMEGIAKSIALQTKFSAEEAAQAYFFLASSGLNAAESMKALPVAAQFAQAGVINLEKATELLSDAYITLGLRSEDPIQNMKNMQRVADVLTEANNRAQGSIIEFAQALTNRAGVAFRTFGISVEEGVAALAAFAERGIKGRTAGRQLFIVIRDLQRAVLKNGEAWEKLIGKDAVFSAASGDFKNLADIIGKLEGRLEGLSDKTKKTTLQMLGFQERSLQATLALIGASARIRELEGYLSSAGGVTQRVSEKQMMSFQNRLGLISERLKQVGIDLFDAFRSTIENYVLPMVRSFVQKLESLVFWIKMLHPGTKETIINFMALGVALGPVVALIGALGLALIPLIAAFKFGIAPIWAFVSALGAVNVVILALKGAFATAFAAKTWIAVWAAIKLGAVALALFAAQAIAVGAAIWVAWKAVKALTGLVVDESSPAWNSMSSSIGITTLRLTQLVDEYKRLNIVGPLTEENANRLAHTQEMLAAAMGTSADAFRENESAGRGMFNLVEELSNLELEAGKATLAQHAEKKKALEEESALIRDRISDLTELLNLEKGAPVDVKRGETRVSTSMIGQMPPGGWQTIAVDEGVLERWAEQLKEQIQLLGGVAEATKHLTEDQFVLASSLGLLDEGQKALIEREIEREKGLKNLQMQQRINELQEVAYEKKVAALTASLKGLATEGVKQLGEAFARLSPEEEHNAGVLKRLWEQYKVLRAQLAPGEMPADLEEYTRHWRELSEAEEFAASATGKLIDSMKGIDPVFEEHVASQQLIIDAFNEMKGEMDPRFFKAHGATILTLAEYYSDRLEPAFDPIIDATKEWKKESTATTEKVIKNQQKASNSIIQDSERMTAKMMDKRAELAAFSLSAQDAEIVGLKKGYHLMKLANAEAYDAMVEDVAKLPEAERHAGIIRLIQLEADGNKLLETEERIGQLRVLMALNADEMIIRNHEKLTKEQLDDLIEFLREAEDQWGDYHKRVAALSGAADLFGELGKAIPSLKGVGQALSGIASASELFGTSVEKWGDKNASAFDKITAAVGMATAAVAAFNAISQIESRAGRAGAGALAGAQMGSAFGPIGAAVGAGIGAIVGAIMGDPGWAKIKNAVSLMWKVNITDELAKEIEETSKEIGHDFGAMLLHINQIIEESGGITARNVGKWTRKVRDAFSMIDLGVFTTSQAAEVLDENFAALAESGTQLSGVLRADVFELIQLDEQFQTNSASIKEFKDAMVDQAIAGLIMFTEGVTLTRKQFEEAFDAKIAKLKELGNITEEEINRMRNDFQEKLFKRLQGNFRELSQMVEMTFAAMVEQGKPLVQILLELGPALDELIILVGTLGFTGSDTLEMLLKFREFTKVNEGLMKKIDGARMMMVGLTNAGYLSEKAFKVFGRTVNRQFDQLIKRGLSADEALLLMLPSLIALRDAAELYGFELDEATQNLIDQAEERGLMGEKAKTVDDLMLEGQLLIIEALGVIITLFGGEIPASMRVMTEASKKEANEVQENYGNAAEEIQEDFDEIEMPHIDDIEIRVRYNYDEYSPGGQAAGLAHGGLITRPTLAMVGEGGQPELVGPVGFMSKALEIAMDQTGQTEREENLLNEMRGLRKDMRLMPIHLRDAIILTN